MQIHERFIIVNSTGCAKQAVSTGWHACVNGNVTLVTTSAHSYTDADSVMVYLIVHLILVVVWSLATGGLLTGNSRSKNFFWLCSTAMVLIFGVVVMGLFSVEISDAKVCTVIKYSRTPQ